MQFTLMPPGLEFFKTRVSIDITRRADTDVKGYGATNNILQDKRTTFPTNHPDAANDEDVGSTDTHSLGTDKAARMYSFDSPGLEIRNILTGIRRATYKGKFEEYLRINIGQPLDPSDPTDYPPHPDGGTEDNPVVSGSRASPKYEWTVQHTLIHDQKGTLKRTTGDAEETMENNIVGTDPMAP